MSDHQILALLLGGALLVGAVASLAAAFRAVRRRRLVDDLPTSEAAGVFIGLVECAGTAESPAPRTSFLAEERCVLYRYEVNEHWQRTVVETTTDSKGRTTTRTRTESGTTTVAQGGEMPEFWLQDESGAVPIAPDGADLRMERVFHETCGRSDPLYYGKGPDRAVSDSTHRRTFAEWAIPLHHPVYVIGRSRIDGDRPQPLIAEDPEAPLFVISTSGEKSVSKGYGAAVWGWSVLGLVLAAGATAIATWMARGGPGTDLIESLRPSDVVLFGFAFAAVWLAWWVLSVYNSLVGLSHRAARGDTLIDIELKRRAELIPRLAEVVNGARGHEAEVQELVASMRNEASASSLDVRGLAPEIRVVGERYPEMASQPLFLALQEELAETEDRLGRARAYANELSSNYNNRLEIFPDGRIAGFAKLEPRPLFRAAGLERLPVEVTFED